MSSGSPPVLGAAVARVAYAPDALCADELEPITASRVVALVRRYRGVFLALPLVGALVGAVIGVLTPERYRTVLAIMPQASKADISKLSGLAAQFGVSVGGGSPAESPDLYADLIASREILGPLADSAYRTQGGGVVRLPELLDVPAGPPAIRREETIKALQRRVQPSVGLRTPVVTVAVLAPDPRVAQQMGQHIVALLNEFNLRSRQLSAEAERRFVEGRLRDSRARLELAESRLRDFLERNRSYELSPQLTFEKQRLDREWQLQQQLYSSLAQSLEQARIEEVRNTPSLTVVQQPNLPARREPRGLAIKAIMGAVLGVLLAALWALFADHRGRTAAPVAMGNGRTVR